MSHILGGPASIPSFRPLGPLGWRQMLARLVSDSNYYEDVRHRTSVFNKRRTLTDIGTSRTSALFPGLRRFVYIVRRGAGRRVELMSGRD